MYGDRDVSCRYFDNWYMLFRIEDMMKFLRKKNCRNLTDLKEKRCNMC